MNYTMTNGTLFVAVSSIGGQLLSIVDLSQNNKEYLWLGDEAYWKGRAPNLFPITGRVPDGTYTYKGNTYTIDSPHGFIRHSVLQLTNHAENFMEFGMKSNAQTRKQYPFDFDYRVRFTLDQKKLTICYTIRNTSPTETMLFSVGAHPGFQVPITDGEVFEDYMIEFEHPAHPQRLLLDGAHLSGKKEPYPLQNDTIIPLQHNLFDNEMILLEQAARSLTIHSARNQNGIRVSYPDFTYVGFWQPVQTDAPFICVEPWNGLPSVQNGSKEFSSKPGLCTLQPLKTYQATYSIEVY